MNPYEVFFAIFALLGVAIVVPGWIYFVNTYLNTTPAMQFLSTMALPFMAMLLVGSWLQPG